MRRPRSSPRRPRSQRAQDPRPARGPRPSSRLRAKLSDVILIHFLFMHGGNDEIGFRFFACYSDKVSCIQIYPSTLYAAYACSLCKLQVFTHVSNVLDTGPDSLVLAAMFNKVLQPLLVKEVPQQDEGAEHRHATRSYISGPAPPQASPTAIFFSPYPVPPLPHPAPTTT